MRKRAFALLYWIVTLLLITATGIAASAIEGSDSEVPAAVALNNPTPMANEYYVTGRYYCADDRDNSDRGTCDLTTHANSCQAALNAHRAKVSAAGDICRKCTDGVTDNTKHYSGRMEWIHLGPCRGFPN